jgi:hypothetical protein
MRLPAGTLVGLALLEVNAKHADPKAKGLFGVIGRKLHQGDRVLRHRVKTHTRRVVALDHRRPDPAVRVRSHIRAVDPLPLIGYDSVFQIVCASARLPVGQVLSTSWNNSGCRTRRERSTSGCRWCQHRRRLGPWRGDPLVTARAKG